MIHGAKEGTNQTVDMCCPTRAFTAAEIPGSNWTEPCQAKIFLGDYYSIRKDL